MKQRILFVDDESRVLDGLRRSLRRYRDHWDTHFAEGGEAAIQELEKTPYDIVVSDMRMPGMDGFELLTHVREHFPNALRIVLSGQTDRETAIRSVSVSHQFLAKPCEGDQLRQALDRACKVRELCLDEHHRGVVSKLGSLPSAPSLYLELTEALGDDNTSSADIASIVEQDMAMSVKILQIVNSAYFGLSREVSSIRDAVSYLGMTMIRSLALAEGAFAALKNNAAFSEKDLKLEQEHALLTASIARAMCEDAKLGEQALLAGMVHDLGILILATQFPQEYAQLNSGDSGDTGVKSDRNEHSAFGTSHDKIGAFLLGTWGLPLRVTEAVAFHHDPLEVDHDEFDVVTAVHVANGLANELLPIPRLGQVRGGIDMNYLEKLGLTGQLDEWRATAAQIVSNAEESSNAA